MTIDPNSLLIFEVREEELENKHAAKQKAAKPASTVTVKQEPVQKPVQEPVQKPVQKAGAGETAPEQHAATSYNDTEPYPSHTTYKPYEQEEESLEESKNFVVQEPSEEEVEESISMITDRAATSAMVSKKGRAARASKNEEESREAAQGLYCVWHPWRPAYAICAYCHRPFCFEDIVESNGNYYCLEDIDKVAAEPATSVYVKYNNLSIVSASMLLIAFIMFLYFGSGQIISMIKFSSAVGILAFAAKLNGVYGFVFFSTIMSIFVFVAAVLIFFQTKRSFAFGLLVSFINLAAFSYEYLSTSVTYEALVSIASFAGLISLLYSRSAYEGEEEEELLKEPSMEPGELYPAEVPNVGKF